MNSDDLARFILIPLGASAGFLFGVFVMALILKHKHSKPRRRK